MTRAAIRLTLTPLTASALRPQPLVRLTDGQGHVAAGVKIDKVRQLVVNELNSFPSSTPDIEEFVNNTYWDGLESPNIASDFATTKGISELPRVGSTELWEMINFETGFGWHPMHTHLVQFQILNRQNIDAAGYQAAWNAAFPSSCSNEEGFCPGYGPPLPYDTPNSDEAVGGNPALGDKSIPSYLSSDPTPPDPGESGWKDTVKSLPGTVTRILVRFAPTSTPVHQAYAGVNRFPFDPTKGIYVWHCHIIDHEDNEMMRPYRVLK
jgi:spore coat protein A